MKFTIPDSGRYAAISLLGEPSQVAATLLAHAAHGLMRPGSWEREWLMQAFGPDAIERAMDALIARDAALKARFLDAQDAPGTILTPEPGQSSGPAAGTATEVHV